MKRSLKVKLILILCAILYAAWVVVPQFIPPDTKETLPSWISERLHDRRINLGLDLQGGVHLVLGLDIDRVLEETLRRTTSSVVQSFENEHIEMTDRSFAKEYGYHIVKITFPSPEAKNSADALLAKNYPLLIIHYEDPTSLYLRMDDREVNEIKEKTIEQSIEVLQNRIDEFGVREPIITKVGIDQIQVQFPGLKDTAHIKDIISRTARLEFRMVDDALSTPALMAIVQEAKTKGVEFVERAGVRFSDYTDELNNTVKDQLPPNTVIRFERKEDDQTKEVSHIPLLVKNEVPLTGLHLVDARVGVNPETQQPEVPFSLNPTGTQIFAELSRANVGKRMAIILDDVIYSSPVFVQEILGGHARITLGGYSDYSQLLKEATDLVIVLRAGSLPTTLEFQEERTVGPSLGSDNIRAGSIAALVGGILVILFIIAYYSLNGLIGAFALILNCLFLLALLTTLGATLTLPGIAGIALTFGMSVDANILVFERIRENLRRGRSIANAVLGGYEKAFITIFDANITTVFAGIILMQFGTGPIKGFAVTLILGILTSVFTAYFIAKAISEWVYNRPNVHNIYIGIPWQDDAARTRHYKTAEPSNKSGQNLSSNINT